MAKTFFSILFILSCQLILAQVSDDMTVNKGLLIIASAKSLTDAYKIAHTATQKTGFVFRDTKLQLDSLNGVTFPADTCKNAQFDYPCYVARGRYDDGVYISIEYSNAYSEFSKNYFLVIAASGTKDDNELKNAYKQVKKYYADSYIKQTKVYMGCMH